MRIEDLPGALRKFRQQHLVEVSQAQAARVQGVYNRVLRDGQGKTTEDMKVMLATAWRSEFGSDLTEPKLSQAAAELAAGKRIVVKLELKR